MVWPLAVISDGILLPLNLNSPTSDSLFTLLTNHNSWPSDWLARAAYNDPISVHANLCPPGPSYGDQITVDHKVRSIYFFHDGRISVCSKNDPILSSQCLTNSLKYVFLFVVILERMSKNN